MKKRTLFLIFVAAMLVFLSACKSAEKCAAYGESKRYQKEIAY